MERTAARALGRWLGLLIGSGALLVSESAEATCMELDTYACEIIPTYGDCNSPETDAWPPDTPFTYRIGCEGVPDALSSPDLELAPGGTLLKARPQALRQCEQWSLWVLEDPLPAPGPAGTIALSPKGATKPLRMNVAIVADAAKAPRGPREPKRDFVCSVQRGIEQPSMVEAPRPAGCAACGVSLAATSSQPSVSSLLMAAVALGLRRARRPALTLRRA